MKTISAGLVEVRFNNDNDNDNYNDNDNDNDNDKNDKLASLSYCFPRCTSKLYPL